MNNSTDTPPPSMLQTNQEETWVALRDFYAKNHAAIEKSKNLNVGEGQFHEHLDQVLEASQFLVDGLIALANVHPVIGVAVFAFHTMIKLDITRRSNNRKVLAVKLQMQSMMSAMFQLCELKHVHVLDEPQKAAQRAQLQGLINTIAVEIKKCSSDLTYYSDRKFVSKLIKANMYEQTFAGHVETFALRRSELQTTITAYISGGIDAANIAIGQVGQKVEVVGQKLDNLLAAFKRLDTTSERELLKFIDDNGGAERCISKDESLRTLLTKSGHTSQSESLAETKKALRIEFSEDLDAVLTRNLARFESLLVVQNNNLERLSGQIEQQGFGLADHSLKLDKLLTTSILILEEGRLTKKTVVPNAPIRLKDPELQRIWEGMGLSSRRSVKAKQFVLTLRDYLVTSDHSAGALFLDAGAHPSDAPEHLSTSATQDDTASDSWVLKHINAAHVQPIIEAMDEDASGFISVQEANKFALSRQKGMKLLHWFAYWAAGWRYTITDYRRKIYKVMQNLHAASASVLAVNRRLVALYLDNPPYFRIEGILRHITQPASKVSRDPKLAEVAASIAAAQEERLKSNLNELHYVLGSVADVTLVTGNERLETWLLPLLCIVLHRHLEIMIIAQSRPLLSREFIDHCFTIDYIISGYDERMQHLRDIFRPFNRDTETHFQTFAYGMLVDAFNWTGSYVAKGNTLLSFFDESRLDAPSVGSDEAKEPHGKTALDTGILAHGVASGSLLLGPDASDLVSGSSFALEKVPGGDDCDTKGTTQTPVLSNIEGPWVGSFEGDYPPPFECVIPTLVDGIFEAKGRDYVSPLVISGVFDAHTASVSVKLCYEAGFFPVRLEGTYDSSRNKVQGYWETIYPQPEGNTKDDAPETPRPRKTFTMTRHTVSSFRFRSLLDSTPDGPETSVARRRWAFALQTIRFEAQARLGSWEFMRRRVAERNDWIELCIRRFPPDEIVSVGRYLNDMEFARWQEIERTVHPRILALYHFMQRFFKDRRIYDVGWVSCDVCQQSIMFRHYMCITCIKDDYDGTWLNFCVENGCSEIQDTFDSYNLVHTRSHTLLRATERIYTYELPTIISRARTLSEIIKKAFRESNTARNLAEIAVWEPYIDENPTCRCCGERLTLPCWACVGCGHERIIVLCLQCEDKLKAPLKPRNAMPDGHSSLHHLIRISDSIEAKFVEKNSQDKRMDDMEAAFNNSLREVEQKLDHRMAVLETKVDSLVSLIHQMLQAGANGQER